MTKNSTVYSFYEWHHHLKGAAHPIIVYINHKILNTSCLLICQIIVKLVEMCYYFALTSLSHIPLENNKNYWILCLGGYILHQEKEKKHMINN